MSRRRRLRMAARTKLKAVYRRYAPVYGPQIDVYPGFTPNRASLFLADRFLDYVPA